MNKQPGGAHRVDRTMANVNSRIYSLNVMPVVYMCNKFITT